MNVLDILICVLLAWGLIRGFYRGLISEVSSLLGVVAGFVAANSFYTTLADKMYGFVSNPDSPWVQNPEYSMVVAFILLFVVFYFLVVLAGWGIKSLTKVAGLGWVDRVSGVLFGALKACLIAMVLVIAYTSLMPQGKAVWVNNSKLTPYVNMVTEKVINVIPWDLRQKYYDKLTDVQEHWLK